MAENVTIPALQQMKRDGKKSVGVVAWDYQIARIAERAGVDFISVGDSVGANLLGHANPLEVTLDEMLVFCKAVRRGVKRALVSCDIPYGPVQEGVDSAMRAAIRLVKEGGADLVKLEGAGRMVSRVRAIAESNIGVMAHVGLTPQSATKLGGFRAQGRTADAALKLHEDALALQDAGAFAIVLEAVPSPVATRITESVEIPTIGIGAGAGCDGQVLVWHDLLGMYHGHTPRFVKRYAEIADEIGTALGEYVAEVRSGAFPDEQHTYAIPDEELAAFETVLSERQE
jgi:3-methyl-2-oxobutanoate hydroxymethyltransferase